MPTYQRSKAVIFDFDGTIADSGDIAKQVLEKLLKRSFSKEEVDDLRRSSALEIIKKLNLQKWQIPIIIIRARRGVASRINEIRPFHGISQALKHLADDNYKIYIVSSSDKHGITSFLNTNNLSGYPTKVYSGVGFRGKARVLGKLLKNENLLPSDCVYIGDETRDVDAANEVAIKCIAVTWGYNKAEALIKHSPSCLVKNPNEIVKAVSSLI